MKWKENKWNEKRREKKRKGRKEKEREGKREINRRKYLAEKFLWFSLSFLCLSFSQSPSFNSLDFSSSLLLFTSLIIRLLSSVVDVLITHPNVLNGAMLSRPMENVLYVEGSFIIFIFPKNYLNIFFWNNFCWMWLCSKSH